jgi:ferredoxin--NADP+ reductase
MSETAANPLRIAIIGAGPAGFFAAAALLGQSATPVTVDLFDALPTPFGLVRFGVAPDHAKIKSVTRTFEKTAADPRFRFLGNVTVGRDVSREELLSCYDRVLYTVGAQSDRKLGVEGEELDGSFSATEFVAWYNGHPDFAERTFDLSCSAVVIVGVGNVAMDVARILAKTPDELHGTDIAAHALEALRESRIRDIYILARRGPAQAKFTNPEVKEFGELGSAVPQVIEAELELDEVSQAQADADKTTGRNIETLRSFIGRTAEAEQRRVHFRFCLSPTALLGQEGRLTGVRVEQNALTPNGSGDVSARGTGNHHELEAGLLFRSVGYRGTPLEGLPFDGRNGVIPNEGGRITQAADDQPASGREYVAGWIKRGPSGVIGTNKPCAVESAEALLADAASAPAPAATGDIDALLAARGVRVVTFEDWKRLDAAELEDGAAAGRPRVKLASRAAMLARLG